MVGNTRAFTTNARVSKKCTEKCNRLNFSNPTILNLDNTTFNQEYAVIPEDYNQGYVYLVITSQNLPDFPNKIIGAVAHPIHMHGHDFVILAQSSATYNVNTSISTFNFNNPPRRDVALLPQGGYLAIAFKPDNPGVWLLHCHIGEPLFPHLELNSNNSVTIYGYNRFSVVEPPADDDYSLARILWSRHADT